MLFPPVVATASDGDGVGNSSPSAEGVFRKEAEEASKTPSGRCGTISSPPNVGASEGVDCTTLGKPIGAASGDPNMSTEPC